MKMIGWKASRLGISAAAKKRRMVMQRSWIMLTTATFSLQSSRNLPSTMALTMAPAEVPRKRLFVAIELPDMVRTHCLDTIRTRLLPLDLGHEEDCPTPTQNESTVKWILDESLFHCTLQFLGSVDQDRIPALNDALDRACRDVRPFSLRLGTLGCFPNHSSTEGARVIWYGLEEHDGVASTSSNLSRNQRRKTTMYIEDLSRVVMDAAAEVGLLSGNRKRDLFHAHVTLGRVRTQDRKKRTRQRKKPPTAIAEPLKDYLEGQFRASDADCPLSPFPVTQIALVESILSNQGPRYETLKRFELKGE